MTRVLVVEDEEGIRGNLLELLEAEGYTAIGAENGLVGVRSARAHLPDLILCDILMPGLDGFGVLDELRQDPVTATIPFVFLTAKVEGLDVRRGMERGADDYLTKPFEREDLVVAVRARLERAQAIRKATEEEFDRLKEQIVIMLSHELRTPLTSVVSYTQLALNDVSLLSPGDLQEYLMGVKRGADRLAWLVEDMLLLVQLDVGQAKKEFCALARVHAHLDAVVKRTVRLYEEQAAARGVALEVRVEPGLPPVQLHETFFVDALRRLVDNACKFSRGKGKRVTVSAQAVDSWAEVVVTDEGVGIPPDEIPHLFERFRQINRKKMEQQGAGLGLAIARGLVRLHGGDITVQSAPGQGSAFTIRLPAAETRIKAEGSPSCEPAEMFVG